MSSTHTVGKRTTSIIPEAYELVDQIEGIRAELQSLRSTVGHIASKQIRRAQNKGMEAEEVIRQNPLSAVAIAVGLGFLFGAFTRR
jgi:ElaB/YqjD/DUF883 family membrane-anchored ribosome-binding protein